MNKYDFITALQKHLTGKVSVQKLNELTDYYNNYIDTEIRKGKSEKEVLESLGDPRLLARSIAETEKERADERSDDYQEYGSAYYENENEYRDAESEFVIRGKVVPKWKLKLFGIILFIVFLLILFVILRVLGFALGIIFRFILPVAIPAAVIYFVISLFLKK